MEREWLQIRVVPVGDETTPWLNDAAWCRCLRTVLARLEENQRRWVLGLLSLQTGRGGISRLVDITGVNNNTFTTARHELACDLADCPRDRIRREGGGRKPLTETDPTLESDLEELIQGDVAGDPNSGDRWVRQTLRQLCQALRRRGHAISRMTVRDLLKKKGFRSRPTASGSPARATRTASGSSATSRPSGTRS